MEDLDIQILARDVIVKVGKDGYYHGGCSRLAVSPRAKAWQEVGEDIQKENLLLKDRIAVKKEILRLVSGWKRINESQGSEDGKV